MAKIWKFINYSPFSKDRVNQRYFHGAICDEQDVSIYRLSRKISGRAFIHDEIISERRPRKLITETMCRMFLHNHGEFMEGDCSPVPIVTISVDHGHPFTPKMDGLFKNSFLISIFGGTKLHEATRWTDRFNGAFWLKKTVDRRRPRKMLRINYLRSFVKRLGGRLK